MNYVVTFRQKGSFVLYITSLSFFISCFVLSAPSTVNAFQFEHGELFGTLDTTVSIGSQWRMAKRDKSLIGRASGGRAFTVNQDDGNKNYSQGKQTSTAVKATHDFELQYHQTGLFSRVSYFYDFYNMSKDALPDRSRTFVGRDLQVSFSKAAGIQHRCVP